MSSDVTARARPTLPPRGARRNAVVPQADALRKAAPLEYYSHFLARSVRPDGRGLLRARHVRVSPGMISSADGSALVKLGKTVVLAGVRCEPTLPAEAEPACGQVHARCAGGCTHDA